MRDNMHGCFKDAGKLPIGIASGYKARSKIRISMFGSAVLAELPHAHRALWPRGGKVGSIDIFSVNLVLGPKTYVTMTFILTWHRGCYRLKSRARCFHALIPRESPLSLCIRTSLFAQDVWWFGASEVCEKRACKDMLEQCPIPSHAVGLSSSKCEAGGIAHMSQSLCSGCSSAYRICRSRRRFRECVLT